MQLMNNTGLKTIHDALLALATLKSMMISILHASVLHILFLHYFVVWTFRILGQWRSMVL